MSRPLPTSALDSAGLRHRYELLEEIPHASRGQLFRARDLVFGETVGLKLLGPDCGLEPAERRQWEDAVRHLQSLPHPNLVHFHSLDAVSGVLVRDWIDGISVLDLLRRRRELQTVEAFTLLAALPGTLDFLAASGVAVPRPLLNQLFIELTNPDLAASPIEQWPAFTLKLNALSRRGRINVPAEDDATVTVVLNARELDENIDGGGPRELGRLLYELLGGRSRELEPRRYSPIGALSEQGNAILQETLFGVPPADCQTLWRSLLAAQSALHPIPPAPVAPTNRRPALRIPEKLLAAAQPGVALQAEPLHAQGTPIRLVARARFTIGRSSQQADYLARLLPENETNLALTARLGRVHCHLKIGADALQIYDGNGTGPSLNGTWLDDQRLDDAPVPLPARPRLCLAQEYALELAQLPASEPPSPEISNFHAWTGAPPLPPRFNAGALVCLPRNGQSAVQHTAWIFSEAPFGLASFGEFVWDTRAYRRGAAAFHYHRGCFWLANYGVTADTIAIGVKTLAPGEIAPLTSGMTLRLGPTTFTVHVD